MHLTDGHFVLDPNTMIQGFSKVLRLRCVTLVRSVAVAAKKETLPMAR